MDIADPVPDPGKLVREVYSEQTQDFPGSPAVEKPPANAGHLGSVPDPVRSHMPQGN